MGEENTAMFEDECGLFLLIHEVKNVKREECPEQHACQISHVRFDNLEKAIPHYS